MWWMTKLVLTNAWYRHFTPGRSFYWIGTLICCPKRWGTPSDQSWFKGLRWLRRSFKRGWCMSWKDGKREHTLRVANCMPNRTWEEISNVDWWSLWVSQLITSIMRWIPFLQRRTSALLSTIGSRIQYQPINSLLTGITKAKRWSEYLRD